MPNYAFAFGQKLASETAACAVWPLALLGGHLLRYAKERLGLSDRSGSCFKHLIVEQCADQLHGAFRAQSDAS